MFDASLNVQKNERPGCGVHKLPLRLWIWVVLLLPGLAHAAGLGKLTVTSALGQPLTAQIELVSVHRDELGSLAARLASQETYRQANLQYLPALSSLRFSIEKRNGGQPYVQVTSTRPINEPVVDLLVELAWSSGRISRSYTALIDPPGYGQPAPAEAVAAPEAQPIAPPSRAVESRPEAPVQQVRRERTTPGQYGPIKRGQTLTGVAAAVKPEGVTLEQMLVGLYRNNPDAFVNNMNRMKTGRILRVPDKAEIAAIAPDEARKEIRVQASDWNAYRRRLADTARTAEERSATSGRITARVEEPGEAAASRDVVRLSKSEAPGASAGGATGGSAADRLRALEEESVARDKALTEAHERIAQLEKTIREQQRLLELKGAPLGTQPQQPIAKPGEPAAPPKTEAAPPAPAPAPAAATPAAPAASKDAKPKVVSPPPSTDFMDVLLEEPLYLAAAGGVLALGVLVYVLSRRRRAAGFADEPVERAAPIFGSAAATAAPAPAFADAAPVAAGGVDIVPQEEVDALAEAEVYIAYGRDAQAEEILKEALAKTPSRQDVQLKLLEIYAARKDRSAFTDIAGKLHQQTGGMGEAWTKAAAMGRTLAPDDVLYAAAGTAVAAAAVADTTTTAAPAHADALDLDLSTPATRPDVPLDVTAMPPVGRVEPEERKAPETAASVEPLAYQPPEPQGKALAPDFTLDIPPATTDATPAPAMTDTNVIDFNLELPKVEPAEVSSAPAPQSGADAGLDFKLDFGNINLNLDEETPATTAGGEKDAHWHDVQQKFDLAKAYEEMGDKEGAREVLQEVLGEGDREQQAQAKKLLEALA